MVINIIIHNVLGLGLVVLVRRRLISHIRKLVLSIRGTWHVAWGAVVLLLLAVDWHVGGRGITIEVHIHILIFLGIGGHPSLKLFI